MVPSAAAEATRESAPAQHVPLPLSHQQEAVWLLDQFLGPQQRCALNLCYEFEFQGLPDVDALRKAVTALGSVHPVLRTQIWLENGSVWQGLREKMPALTIVDFRQRPEPSTNADAMTRTEAERIISMKVGPLISFILVYVDQEQCRLLMNIHHVIADGTSIHILRADLAALYVSFATGNPVTLNSTGFDYKRFLAAQAEGQASGAFTEHERYWSSEFCPGIPTLDLQQRFERPSSRSFRASRLVATLDQKLIEACLRTGFRLRVPLSALLLSGLALLLARLTGEWQMVIGTGFTGRRPGDSWQHAVGLFANAVPLAVRLDPGWNYADILRHVASKYVGAYDHQDYPLQRMLTQLVPSRSPQYAVPFRIGYNYQSSPAARVGWGGLKEVRFDRVYSAMCPFDLVLDVMLSSESSVATFVYATDVFPRELMATMAERYIRLLEAFVN